MQRYGRSAVLLLLCNIPYTCCFEAAHVSDAKSSISMYT
jgi:hypothetical protein